MLLTSPSFSPFSEPLSTVFTFQAVPLPPGSLKLKRKQTTRTSPKRCRPREDVEDGVSASKKKRRLRLHLITSRLSRPFSTPATHIVDPGTSKIAVWAKQRHLTQQVLRKAAIMNRVRRKTLERKDSGISVGEDERREARERVMEGVHVEDVVRAGLSVGAGLGPNAVAAHLSPVDEAWSHSSSPLGLSNYDALDDEDDWYESYHDEDEGGEGGYGPPFSKLSPEICPRETSPAKSYYTDWNLRDADGDDEGGDTHGIDALPPVPTEMRPPSPPEGRMMELLKEKERQQEIISGFLHFA